MSDADKAYAAAERLIDEAKREGADSLSFDREETRALDHLPPSIAELTELRDLDLNNTQVSDIAPLAALTRLTRLWLNTTQVSDIAPLAALTRLTGLWLNTTQVSDIAPLAALTRLTELWLVNAQVSDIAALAALARLTTLSLNNTQVSDIAPLAALTQLTNLSLSTTQASDIAPLAALTQLTRLSLNNTQVSDIASLAALTPLTGLLLNNTQVSDIAPLAALTQLTMLWLDNTQVHDLRPLRRLTRLAANPELNGLTFTNCTAAQQDPEIARIAKIEVNKIRAQTLFDYLEDWQPPETAKPRVPSAAPQPIALAANAVSVPQIRNQFRANRPEFSSRLEHLMVLVQQEQAVHRLIPIPNEEAAKAEYDAKTGFLEVMKTELIALRDELPEDHARPLSEKEARGLKQRLVHLAQLTDRCITFLDKEQGTYGGLYKIGLISAVAGLLSLVPGLNMIASTALAGGVFGVQTVRLHIRKD